MQFLIVVLVVLSVVCSKNVVFGQNDNAEEETRNSILLESVLNGDIDGIERAMEADESIDTTNVNGWSAAHFAVSGGNFAVLEAVVEKGIDLNLVDEAGVSALMLAASQVSQRIQFVTISSKITGKTLQ